MWEIASARGGRDDERDRAVRLEGAIVETERLVDPPRRQVLLQRQRRAREGVGIGAGVPVERDRDLAQVLARAAVDVLVTAGPHRHPLRGDHVALRRLELHLAPDLDAPLARVAEPESGTAVHRPEDHRGIAQTRRHGGRCVGHHAGRVITPAVHVDVPVQVADADGVRELVAEHRVAGLERARPVDVGRRQARIGDRRPRRLGRLRQHASARRARERGAADPDDGGSSHVLPLASVTRSPSRGCGRPRSTRSRPRGPSRPSRRRSVALRLRPAGASRSRRRQRPRFSQWASSPGSCLGPCSPQRNMGRP